VASGLAVTLTQLCEAQDAVTMQILATARLARQALDSGAADALDDIGHTLDLIARIAGEANAAIDEAQAAAELARSQI